MGMYDNVDVEVPLPDGWNPPKGGLQTKDFSCDLETLTITADGRIVSNGRPWFDHRQVTEGEFKEIVKRIDKIRELLPNYVSQTKYEVVDESVILARRKDLEFHGVMEMIGTEPSEVDGGNGAFHVYHAKFDDGRLVEIKAMPDGPTLAFEPRKD